MRYSPLSAAVILATTLSIVGCSEAPSVQTSLARGVKIQRASTDISAEPLIGIVRAEHRAELAFVQAGRVDQVLVDIGQTVKRGQRLASIDRSVQTATLRAAEGERKAAEAALASQRMDQRRTVALHSSGEASDASVAAATASLQTAIARLDAAITAESDARWKHEHATLTAPFEGSITARSINPGAYAAEGDAVLVIEDPTTLQVVVDVPLGFADSVAPGTVLKAESTRNQSELEVRLNSVGASVVGTGTAKAIFQVIGHPVLRSGEGVRVFFSGPHGAETKVPVQALLFGKKQGKGEVFIFDATNLTVKKREVTYIADESGDAQITSGVGGSDWVVVAGASQLRDGQRAKPINNVEAVEQAKEGAAK